MKRGNGQGTAFKRGSTWTAQITEYTYEITDEYGNKIRKRHYKTKGGFRTKREAIAYIEQLRLEKTSVPTFQQYLVRYDRTLSTSISKNKRYAYHKAASRLESIMGKRVDEVTVAQLQKVVDDNSNSYATAKDMRIVLSALFRMAIIDQYVPTNLAQYIKLPDHTPKESEPFTDKEIKTMWQAYADGDPFVGYLLLMIYSGMMPGELLTCRKHMINMERCEIYGCGKKTSARKEVSIVFADIVKPVLQSIINNEQLGDKLYNRDRNRFYMEYHDCTKRIGIRDLPPYSCRHTTGTTAAKLNLNAATIQKIMRHARISTSQHYIHLGAEETHAAMNKL